MIYDQVFSTQAVANGDLRYRIEVCMAGPYQYLQRHIWLPGNRPYGLSMEGVDPWISSLKCCFDSVRMSGYEVSEVLPGEAH